MKILVCIKQVPESNRVEVDPVTGVLKRDGAASKMNPYDLYAIETALRIREEKGGTVQVIWTGPPQAQQVIREAFAMGADGGVLLSDRKFGGADVLATSYTIAQGIRACGEFDLILCGKQTTDGDTAQVGAEISEWLKIPSVANVTRIQKVENDGITVAMDLPGGAGDCKGEIPLPVVRRSRHFPAKASFLCPEDEYGGQGDKDAFTCRYGRQGRETLRAERLSYSSTENLSSGVQ